MTEIVFSLNMCNEIELHWIWASRRHQTLGRKGVRVGKSLGGVGTSAGSNQVVKGGRVRDTRAEVLDVPQIAESLQHRGGSVGSGLAGDGVGTVVLDVAGRSVGRHEPGGHTATETVEVQSV